MENKTGDKMKIEINVNDILNGNVEDIIREAIDEKVNSHVKQYAKDKVDKAVNEALNAAVAQVIQSSIDSEFTVHDRWGSPKEVTTFKKAVQDRIQAAQEHGFKGSYSSETFSDALNSSLRKEIENQCKDLVSKSREQMKNFVDSYLLNTAVEELKKRIGSK